MDVSKFKTDKSLQELSEKTFNIAFGSLYASRKNLLAFAGAMKLIRDKELFHYKDYENFETLCVSPEISLKPATVQMYISLYEYWIENQEKKMDDMAGIEFNKLVLLKKVKHPEKFFHDAKTLTFIDFKKKVSKEEFKMEQEDDDLQGYQKKHRDCPFWIDCKCAQGINTDEPEVPRENKTEHKKKKDKKDDLI